MFSARSCRRNADSSVQAQCSHEDRIDNLENENNATAQLEAQEEEEQGLTQNAHAQETHAERVPETHNEQPNEDGGGAEDAAREGIEQDIPPQNADAAPEPPVDDDPYADIPEDTENPPFDPAPAQQDEVPHAENRRDRTTPEPEREEEPTSNRGAYDNMPPE